MKVEIDLEALKKELIKYNLEGRGKYITCCIAEMLENRCFESWVVKKRRQAKRKPPAGYSEHFIEFWGLYHPLRRKAKRKAFEAWWNAGIDEPELLELCKSTLQWQKISREWQEEDGKYFPLATTWLNGRRWEDENPCPESRIEEYTDMFGEKQTRIVEG
jgi:hypothetical protein